MFTGFILIENILSFYKFYIFLRMDKLQDKAYEEEEIGKNSTTIYPIVEDEF